MGGLNWTSRADPVEASSSDWFLDYPGNEADDADGYLIYYDDSAGALSMKVYDDSADSWAETSIDASVNGHNNHLGFHGTIDDNGDLFVVYWNDHDAATADLECGVWDSGGWTAKTDVVGNFDDIEDCCVFCDRNTGDLYVAYNGSDDGSESAHSTVKCYHKISNNGGTSWGTQQAMGETGDDNRSVRCDLGPQSGEDGLFLPIWSNDDLNDNFCNAGNAVEITGSSGFSGDIASLIAEVKAALVGAQTDPGVLTSKIASIKSALVGAMLPKGDIDSTAAPVKASLVGAKTYAGVLDSTAAPVKDSLVGAQTHPGALASKVASIKSAFVGAQTVPGVLASTVAYVKTALVGSQAGGPEFTGVLGSLIAPAKAALIGAQTVPGVLGSVASFESDGNGRPVQVVLTADAAASAATLTIKPDHPDLADNDVLLFGENIRIQVDGACLAGDISLAIDPAAVGPLKAGDIGKKLQDLTGYTIAGEVLAKRGDATAIIEFPSGDVTIPTQSTVANRGQLQVAYVAVDTSSENPGSYYGTIWKTDPGTTRPLWEGVVRVTEAGFL